MKHHSGLERAGWRILYLKYKKQKQLHHQLKKPQKKYQQNLQTNISYK